MSSRRLRLSDQPRLVIPREHEATDKLPHIPTINPHFWRPSIDEPYLCRSVQVTQMLSRTIDKHASMASCEQAVYIESSHEHRVTA